MLVMRLPHGQNSDHKPANSRGAVYSAPAASADRSAGPTGRAASPPPSPDAPTANQRTGHRRHHRGAEPRPLPPAACQCLRLLAGALEQLESATRSGQRQ